MALLMTFPAPRLVLSLLLGARSAPPSAAATTPPSGSTRAPLPRTSGTRVEFRVISGKSWLIVGDDAPSVAAARSLSFVRGAVHRTRPRSPRRLSSETFDRIGSKEPSLLARYPSQHPNALTFWERPTPTFFPNSQAHGISRRTGR